MLKSRSASLSAPRIIGGALFAVSSLMLAAHAPSATAASATVIARSVHDVQHAHSGSLGLTAWVSPNTMPYDAYPTLYVRSKKGAICSAVVVYSTGRSPVSFPRVAHRVGAHGVASWTWHEETKGYGGNAMVRCTLGNQSGMGWTSFSVD